MSDINVVIGGKQYRMACEDGQESRLSQLARDFDRRIIELKERFGEIGDARLLVMAALMVSDELLDAGKIAEKLSDEIRSLRHQRDALSDRAHETQAAVAAALNAASERIERLTQTLNVGPGAPGVPVG